MTLDMVYLSPVSPLGIVGLVLGKAEVQGSNPCRGTTPNPRFSLRELGELGGFNTIPITRIMREACG